MSQIDNETQLQENLKSQYFHYVSKMFANNGFNQSDTMEIHFDVAKDKLWSESNLNDENGSVGVLLATKALVQLISTPFVKHLINNYGYFKSTILGTFVLFLASFSMYLN